MPTKVSVIDQFLESISSSDATYEQKKVMYDLFSEYVDEIYGVLKND